VDEVKVVVVSTCQRVIRVIKVVRVIKCH
jgi:hypothetical protein